MSRLYMFKNDLLSGVSHIPLLVAIPRIQEAALRKQFHDFIQNNPQRAKELAAKAAGMIKRGEL